MESSVKDNPFFRRFAARLSKFDQLSERTQIHPSLKAGIAEFFWDQYMPKIQRKQIEYIFFESGSSIACTSEKLIGYIQQNPSFYKNEMHQKLKLRTNNLLSYLDLFLIDDARWEPLNIKQQPSGAFDFQYGSSHGKLKHLLKEQPPEEMLAPEKLPENVQKLVDELREEFSKEFSEKGLILAAASGVELDENSPFLGPHVANYYDMLLKRCLLSLPTPKVLFLDQYKWPFRFRINNCYSICDQSFTWSHLKTNLPLAIAIGAEDRAIRERLCQSLIQQGFPFQIRGDVREGLKGTWKVIAANKLFYDYFKE